MNGHEKSDPAIVAMKLANEAGQPVAESVERRAGAEGNADQHSTHRTQIRARVTQALDRVRQVARRRKKERFTALLHHVNPDTLRTAFYALKRKAAPGADGVTWEDYEADLEPRLEDLHGRIHRGAYRPAIEPRNRYQSGCRRCSLDGRQNRRARYCERPSDPAWSETLACTDAPCAGTGRSLDRPWALLGSDGP